MSRTVRITTLIEDTARGRGTLAEHGLAFAIEADGHRVLFDTGQGMCLTGNATKLSVPLKSMEAVVLSHGHYDHTGGLSMALQTMEQASVYMHPAIFSPKYVEDKGTERNAGMTLTIEDVRKMAAEVVLTECPTEICSGLFTTGEIPRETDFEDTGGRFFSDEDCLHPDPMLDDQAVYFECTEGIVVLLGCAHAGVINTLEYVRTLTREKSIHAVMGGMHLLNASQERLEKTVIALRAMNVQRIYPAHCTGHRAVLEFYTRFGRQCFPCNVGTTAEFSVA